jgi:hypothetical protein
MTRVCSKCKKELDESQFNKDKTKKDGLECRCKSCIKEKTKKYREKNQEKIKKYRDNTKNKSKEYRINNKKKLSIYRQAYAVNNKNKIKEYNQNYRIEYEKINKEKIKIRKQGYYQKNKEEKIKKSKIYKINRYNNDIIFKLGTQLRNRFNKALKRNQKKGHILNLIGCTIGQLKQHLELKFQENMSWSNWGFGENCWHIDHIIPCASFDLNLEENQCKCFHYTNLQPLWQKDNLEKSDKLNWSKS